MVNSTEKYEMLCPSIQQIVVPSIKENSSSMNCRALNYDEILVPPPLRKCATMDPTDDYFNIAVT